MELRKVGIIGTGSYLPEDKITNADLEKIVETSNEWIVTRTGVSERRRSRADQPTSELAYQASLRALEAAGVKPEEIDAIVVATITSDMPFPSTACWLQRKLGASNASAHDISAACSGFIYALRTGKALIASGVADTVLLVGAEELTKVANYEDRGSCILFGDGAGAMVLRPTEKHEILDTYVRADGINDAMMSMMLYNGGTQHPFNEKSLENKEHKIILNGREVYKFAVTKFYELILGAAERLGKDVNEIDWIVPHQVNMRIVEGAAERLKYPLERMCLNIEKYGNTSAASIPIVFDEQLKAGKFKDGNLLVMCAFGAGLTWGSATVRW